MTATSPDERPAPQYLSAEEVLSEMGEAGSHRVSTLSALRIFVLSVMAGAFITAGAEFAILLAGGSDDPGVQRLLEGFGFSAGFFFVVLSGTLLFTELNVEMPATLLRRDARGLGIQIAKLWGLAWLGNFLGAVSIGWLIHWSQGVPDDAHGLLREIVAFKMVAQDEGTASAWLKVLVSGMLGNWLVGIAAFLAGMGRTIIGKYIPVLLAVSMFVAAGFQHSPANMGFFSLIMPGGDGPGWGSAIAWNVIPAGIGNILGGAILVALPLWYGHGGRERHADT